MNTYKGVIVEKDTSMKTSLILASYNGEKYIHEQLLSIKNQTIAIDEVIVKDDCSTDNTVKIVQNFITDNCLHATWKILVNKVNVGWKKNFTEGMHLTTGDIIFLCDQDDIWLSNKVEVMLSLINDSKVKLLVSDYEAFSDHGHLPPYVFHPKLGNSYVSFVSCDVHFQEIRRPGCTYCFKRDLLEYYDKVWYEGWAHDSCLWTVAIIIDGLYSVNEPLIRFRRHLGNNTPSNEKIASRRLEIIEFNINVLNILLKNADSIGISDCNLNQILKTRDFFIKRVSSVKAGTLTGFLRMVPYLFYYPKVTSFLGDIVSSKR